MDDFGGGTIPQSSVPGWDLAALLDGVKALLRAPVAWLGHLFSGIKQAALVPVVMEVKALHVETPPPVGQVWKNYILAGGQRVAVREYTSINLTGTVYFPLGDHLGSTSVMVNASTGEVSQIRYSAYGEERYTENTTPTNYRYTGQLSKVATVGLYHYGSRWMDPALAHFTQADTIVPGAGNPMAWDRYLYTLGNPINHFDPTGHSSIAIHDSGEYATPMSEVLKKYGIKFIGGTVKQQAAVLEAAIHIGKAIQKIITWVSSGSQAFSKALGPVTATFSGGGNSCNASGGHGFVCGTGTLSDPRLFTHEFGHDFSKQFADRPTYQLDKAKIVDQNGLWVFGTHDGGYERTILGYKGGRAPNLYHGQEWSDWNSNDNYVARNEDYADMFMNWVYESFDYTGGMLGTGFLRHSWMTVNITETLNGR